MNKVLNTILIALTGIGIAIWSGTALASPLTFTGYSLLAIILAGPAAARTRNIPHTIARSLTATAAILTVALLFLNIITNGPRLLPTPLTVLDAALLTATLTTLATILIIRAANLWSPSTATWLFRGTLLLFLLILWKLPEGLLDYLAERAIIDGITRPVLITSALALLAAWILQPKRQRLKTDN